MTQPDELLWLAYRFSAGELTPAETEAFEARLGVDQAAREALAQAVGLTETVYALEHSAPLGDRAARSPSVVPAVSFSAGAMHRSWSQEAGWIAAAFAACVALVMTWQVFRADRAGVIAESRAQPSAVKPAKGQADVGPVDDEIRMLLAMLDQEAIAPVAAPSVSLGAEDMSESELELVLDGTALDSTVLDGDTTEESLEDQNATPDWLLAAVAESQS